MLSRDSKWKPVTEPKGEFRNWKNRNSLFSLICESDWNGYSLNQLTKYKRYVPILGI